MSGLALVGDIGGTNSRFGLAEAGSPMVRDIESRRNSEFASLEDAMRHYLGHRGLPRVDSAAVAVAGPLDGEEISLTNYGWRFTRTSLRQAVGASRISILNDFEALALSLPHLGAGDLVQIGGRTPAAPAVKIVLGPGTGLGMATLAPLPQGGWMALPGEVGHTTLPVATREEFDWREKMTVPGTVFESEDAITGSGILRMYRAVAPDGALASPEAVLEAARAGGDEAARRTLDQFVVWLARIAGDAAMTMQAKGGVYLAGGIVPSLIDALRQGTFRAIFENRGKLAHVMRPIPVYVIVDRFPALRGCAAALV